ncbi:MAG: hypothetical protein DWG76_04055 [Chloroflexi bacterium]|nr:hypothetical protein [Chloroflexota bacterium]
MTWAPEDGVRIASVVAAYDEGYVVAGRSLREVEARVARLNMILLMGWGVSLAASLVLAWASGAVFKE